MNISCIMVVLSRAGTSKDRNAHRAHPVAEDWATKHSSKGETRAENRSYTHSPAARSEVFRYVITLLGQNRIQPTCVEGDEVPKAAIIEPKKDAKEVKSILKRSGTNEKAPSKAKPVVEVISSTEVQSDPADPVNGADEDQQWYESSWEWERVGDKIEIRVKIKGLVSSLLLFDTLCFPQCGVALSFPFRPLTPLTHGYLFQPTSSIRAALTTLDIEPRRLILTLSPIQTLDLNRMKADGDIVTSIHKEAQYRAKHIAKHRNSSLEKDGGEAKTYEDLLKKIEQEELAKTDKEVSQLLLLKRERPFDVDGCQAEWRAGEDGRGELIVRC